MLNEPLSLTLQIAILASGIYMCLRFLRTTRGGGLLRGLLVAFLVGVIGLWGMSKYLELEELNHIIEGITPYVAVIITVIFQPELRRAMARLGQHNRLAQLLSSGQKETVSRVANAAVAMASRRHGALIAFQQDTPLVAWTANAEHIDAEVSATLLESIFHPGATLHDGGVVIEGDRVVAAACLFPLTENIQLSKSTGTRHRAALGLTEESDAVTLTVSEETGQISIARQGFMSRDIQPADLDQYLRDALGILSAEESQSQSTPLWSKVLASLKSLFMEDPLRKVGSLAIAMGMIYLAHQDIVQTKTFTLQVIEAKPGTEISSSTGLLQVRLPEGSYHLFSPANRSQIDIAVSGTQAQLDRLSGLPGGILNVPLDVPEGSSELEISDITWMQGSAGLEFEWAGSKVPRLEVQRYARHSITLAPTHVQVVLDDIDPHFEAFVSSIEFGQDNVEIEGPKEAIDAIIDGSLSFALEEIRVNSGDKSARREQLRLASHLAAKDIRFLGADTILITLPIKPAPRQLPELELDIVVVNLRPEASGTESAAALAANFVVEQAAQKARFSLTCSGLFDSAPGTTAFDQTQLRIQRYAREQLQVYVDVSGMGAEGGVTEVRWDFPSDWRETLFPGRGQEFADSSTLELQLLSETKVLLRPKS